MFAVKFSIQKHIILHYVLKSYFIFHTIISHAIVWKKWIHKNTTSIFSWTLKTTSIFSWTLTTTSIFSWTLTTTSIFICILKTRVNHRSIIIFNQPSNSTHRYLLFATHHKNIKSKKGDITFNKMKSIKPFPKNGHYHPQYADIKLKTSIFPRSNKRVPA